MYTANGSNLDFFKVQVSTYPVGAVRHRALTDTLCPNTARCAKIRETPDLAQTRYIASLHPRLGLRKSKTYAILHRAPRKLMKQTHNFKSKPESVAQTQLHHVPKMAY
jgi:DNA polymerase III epsilon subunit-like protein